MGGIDYMNGIVKMIGGADPDGVTKDINSKTVGSALGGIILGAVIMIVLGLFIYLLVWLSGKGFSGRRRQRTGGLAYKAQAARLSQPDHSGPLDAFPGNSWQGQEPVKAPSMRDLITDRPVDNFLDVDEMDCGSCGSAPFTGDRKHMFAESLKDLRPIDYLQGWDGEITPANADFVLPSTLYAQ